MRAVPDRITLNSALLQWAAPCAAAASLALIAVRLAANPDFLRQPGATMDAAIACALLIAYGAALLALTLRANMQATMRLAVQFGLWAALIDIGGLVVENFAPLQAPWTAVLALGVMAGTFSLWGAGGFFVVRCVRRPWSGALGGALAAMTTVALAVLCGFALELFLSPPDPDQVRMWAEFQRSGWTDVRAFVVANTLSSAITHMTVGPLVGAVVGAVAGLAARAAPSAGA